MINTKNDNTNIYLFMSLHLVPRMNFIEIIIFKYKVIKFEFLIHGGKYVYLDIYQDDGTIVAIFVDNTAGMLTGDTFIVRDQKISE